MRSYIPEDELQGVPLYRSKYQPPGLRLDRWEGVTGVYVLPKSPVLPFLLSCRNRILTGLSSNLPPIDSLKVRHTFRWWIHIREGPMLFSFRQLQGDRPSLSSTNIFFVIYQKRSLRTQLHSLTPYILPNFAPIDQLSV